MARRRKRGGRGTRDGVGVLLLVLAALGMAGLALGVSLLRPPPLDPETGCRMDRPPAAHTLIVIDATDQLSPRHLRRLRAAAEQERTRLSRYDRLTVALIDPDAPRELRRLFSACDPGDGRSVNPLIANPAQAQTRWQEGFAAPLEEALRRVNGGGAASWSPLVEAVAAAVSEPDFGPAIPQRRLILSTDLLEHHPNGFSLFQEGATLEQFQATTEGRAVRLDLSGVSVRVLLQDHPERGRQQRAARTAFWEPLFDEAGATEVSFDPTL
jgi:hypothetical protein